MSRSLTDLYGIPFKVHGRSKDGLDCWGLAMEVMARYGVELPDFWYESLENRADTRGQILASVQHRKIDRVKEPCLLVLKDRGNPCHVVVYIGEGKIIHSSYNRGVLVEPLHRYTAQIEGIYDVSNC